MVWLNIIYIRVETDEKKCFRHHRHTAVYLVVEKWERVLNHEKGVQNIYMWMGLKKKIS